MMIAPENLKEVVIEDNHILKLTDNLSEYDEQDYDILSEKDFKKYINDIKKDVRSSWEYQRFIRFLREHMDMNKCSFFTGVTNVDSNKIKIEIHHSPLTLHDICVVVFNKRYFYHEDLRVQAVAKEVAICHYLLTVGLIPLSETIHKLVHNGYLFIPPNAVMGRYSLFVDYYKEFMSKEELDTLDSIELYGKMYEDSIYNGEILQQNNIYVDSGNAYQLPVMETIMIAMKDRVHDIKNNNYQLPDYTNQQTLNIINPKPPITANLTCPITIHPSYPNKYYTTPIRIAGESTRCPIHFSSDIDWSKVAS